MYVLLEIILEESCPKLSFSVSFHYNSSYMFSNRHLIFIEIICCVVKETVISVRIQNYGLWNNDLRQFNVVSTRLHPQLNLFIKFETDY